MTLQSTPLVQSFANYALDLRFEDITPAAVEMAKWLIFDTIGTGLGGYQRELGRKAVRFAAADTRSAEATLLGDGRRTALETAAFANGVMIKHLGMDDSHRDASHIASQVVPAVLAVAEAHHTSGRELLTSVVAAYDFAVRLGSAVRIAQRERGLDVKGTVGPMAAALAAGRCAGLDRARLAHALAMAADMASGTEQYVYDDQPCDTKDLIAGFAARNALFAVRLAQADFLGPSRALEGEYGFFRAFGPGAVSLDLADLGTDFAILSTAFKPHGGCRHTHQAVDAVQAIQREAALDPASIQRVLIRTYRYALEPSFRVTADPASQQTAGLSIRVATALALTKGSVWPDDIVDWDTPPVRRLRHITDVEVDPEMDAVYPAQNGCQVIVTLENGQELAGRVPYAKGEPEFRMSETDMRNKFSALTARILSADQADALYATCMTLDQAQTIEPLLRLSTVSQPEAA